MNKEFEEFYANDTRADLETLESKKAMAEANQAFRLARFHNKEAKRKLAEANLLYKSPEQIEQEFLEEEGRITSPQDPALDSVLAELGGEWHSLHNPAYREIYVSREREWERLGLSYSTTVQIPFPPQVRAKYGQDGVIVDVRDVLLMLAQDLETENPGRAAMFREIAEQQYQEEDEEYDEAA